MLQIAFLTLPYPKSSDYRPKIVRTRPKNKMVNPIYMVILTILTILNMLHRVILTLTSSGVVCDYETVTLTVPVSRQ